MATFKFNYQSNVLMRRVQITALIPSDVFDMKSKNYANNTPYKTLYLLHGIKGTCIDWLTLTNVRQFAEEAGIAVIMPSGDNSFYIDNKNIGDYSTFISKELVEFTRHTFNLSTKREDTIIAGCSMGGFGALYNGLKNSEVFGAIGGFSPAILTDQSLKDIEASSQAITPRPYHIPVFDHVKTIENSEYDLCKIIDEQLAEGKALPKLFLTIGNDDYLYKYSVAFMKHLDDKKVSYTFVPHEGAHSWDYWNWAVKTFIDWLK